MAQATARDFADFVALTLKDLGPPNFQQIAQNLQSYDCMSKWLRKERVMLDSGNGIQRNLMSRLSNQAAHVGLMDNDTYDIPDLIDQMDVPWRHAQTKWGYIYQTDILMNGAKSLIANVIEPRRADAMISLAEELEAKAWQTPTASDKVNPYGIPYWIVYNATTGFNGGTPSDHTTVGGIDLTSSPNFKNYVDTYTNVTKTDLIRKMRKAARKIGWKSPISLKDYRRGSGQKLQIYTDETRLGLLEEIGEGQNENLGRDLAPVQGDSGSSKDIGQVDFQLVFRRHPIFWVPQLDDTNVFTACTAPLYMIDHSTFYPVVLRGDFLRESEPMRVPNRHNLFRIFIDLTYNYLCIDRRRNALFATGS